MKKILSLLLILTMLFSFAACHGRRNLDAFVMPEGLDESKTYEITFWAKNDTNKAQVEVYKKAISDFEALYPNIKVNIRLYTDYLKIYNDVITNISTGTTPNVCISYPDHIATYLTGTNVVAPLEELMNDPKFGLGGSELKFDGPDKSEMIESFLEEGKISGSYYALPFMRSTEALYINKTYVEKMGYEIPDIVTWDWIWEVSEAAMKQDADGNFEVNGQNILIPFIYKSTDNMMIQMLNQKGAGYSTEEGEIELFNDTAKEIIFEVAKHAKTKAFSTFKISSYPANFFNAGQCIFAVDSTAGSTWVGTEAPLLDISEEDLADHFDTVVKAIPQFDENNISMISQGPSICLFNKNDSGEVLASWLFAQYLLINDVQLSYAQTEGYAPVTSKAQESDEYIDYLSRRGEDNDKYYSVKIDATKLLLDNIKNTFVTPVFNGSASLRNAAGQLIEDGAYAARREETVNDAFISDLYDHVNSLYRLDQISTNTEEIGDLGPLPGAAKALFICLIVAWVAIISYFIYLNTRKKK